MRSLLVNLAKIHGIAASCFLISSCSTLKDPNDVITIDNVGSKVVVSQADKRAIFMFDHRTKGVACPEPSPDVRADTEGAIKALLAASATLASGASPEAKAELDSTRKMVTAALLQRSQGLQVLRDMLFQACLANLRGDMSAQQYHVFVTQTLPRLTSTLIATEMVTKQEQGKIALTGKDLEIFLNFIVLTAP